MKRLLLLVSLVVLVSTFAAACTSTGFYRDGINMTAAMINPTSVTGEVDATGCNIAVYIDSVDATISYADIHGANYFGVVVNGDANNVSAAITNSSIHDIGDVPLSGAQHGVAVYFRGMNLTTSASGTVSNNQISKYQKGGIVLSGQGVTVSVTDNAVTGWGGSGVNQAMNGIQVGYGASGSVMRNTVTMNTYGSTGPWSAAGILVVGGGLWGTPYTVNARIMNNTLTGNDVGVFVWQGEADYTLPTTTQTNIKIVNNVIDGIGAVNCCGWDSSHPYSFGVSDYGVNDKIINNKITGYADNSPYSGAIDTTGSAKVKVQANKD
jgi:predicted small secreted protein